METFQYNNRSFQNRLISKTIFLVFLNIAIFVWTFFNLEISKRNTFFSLGLLFLVFVFYFLYQNFIKQKKLIQSSQLVLRGNILQQMFSSGECNSMDLRKISRIEKDSYRGFLRYQIFDEDQVLPVINILDSEKFEKRLIEISKKEILLFPFNVKMNLLKAFSFFILGIVCYLLFRFGFLDERIVYLVFSFNFLYFMIQFSEKRFRGGFSESSVRRTVFVLIVLILYQFLSFV